MPTPSNKKKIVKKTTRTFLRHQTDKFKKMGVSINFDCHSERRRTLFELFWCIIVMNDPIFIVCS